MIDEQCAAHPDHRRAERRRFHAGIANFHALYAPLVDAWVMYDNTFNEPLVLDWSEKS